MGREEVIAWILLDRSLTESSSDEVGSERIRRGGARRVVRDMLSSMLTITLAIWQKRGIRRDSPLERLPISWREMAGVPGGMKREGRELRQFWTCWGEESGGAGV